jgi:hypothetical protein
MIATLLRSVRELYDYRVQALDGEAGLVREFRFDDEAWRLRQLVAETPAHGGRLVAAPSEAFDEPDDERRIFPLKIRREALYSAAPERRGLRGTREVAGYEIQAVDGLIGRVDDFIVNDGDWAIRYLVVDTADWLGDAGSKVLISPWWADEISWAKSRMFIHTSREAVKESPPYDFDGPVSREYEDDLFDHYGKPKYWL